MKRSWAGEVRNVSLLVASAANLDGFREILGICEVGVSRPSGPARPPFWRRSPVSGSGSYPCVQRRLGDVVRPPDRTPRQMHLDRRLLDQTPRRR
jgi:hypothetical protein